MVQSFPNTYFLKKIVFTSKHNIKKINKIGLNSIENIIPKALLE